MKIKIRNAIVAVLGIIVLVLLACGAKYYILSKFSFPPKDVRLQNMMENYGVSTMDQSLVVNEIDAALQKYSNWDNLFLSNDFKKKFKNRGGIIDDIRHVASISSGINAEYEEDVVVIYAEIKSGLFDNDDSDDITTEYHFRYVLDENGEIDDLVLLSKQDIYTINGELADDI